MQALPALSRQFETAFRSPPTAARYRATIERSKLPACFFTAPQSPAPNPFDLLLLRPSSVCPSRGALYVTDPLSSSQLCILVWSSGLRSPLGFLRPSGSKRSARLPTEKLSLMLGPISLRSPLAFRFISLPTDQRSRSATAHQVCCPMNLLEPSL
jgi:hypothetical protein